MAEPSEKSKSVKNFIVDGEFLTKLLECPVCLGQLKSSSKVLPCQHTFCGRCLYETLVAQNRLVCPECRAPVNVPFHKLPRNIMLVRFLEGVKNKKVKDAEEVYSRTARLQSLKQEFFSNVPTAIEVVFQKMKEKVRVAEEVNSRPARLHWLEHECFPDDLTSMEVAHQVIRHPQFPTYVELWRQKRESEGPSPPPPPISAIRLFEPEQPSQPNTLGQIPEQLSPPSDSARNTPPSDKDAIAVQNLRRLCEALKASPSNLSAKKSTEPKNKRALNYPDNFSYTGPRKSSGSA